MHFFYSGGYSVHHNALGSLKIQKKKFVLKIKSCKNFCFTSETVSTSETKTMRFELLTPADLHMHKPVYEVYPALVHAWGTIIRPWLDHPALARAGVIIGMAKAG